MISFTRIPIRDFHGDDLSNIFMKQDRPTRSLGIIFPGLNYSVDLPLLYFPRRLLVDQGADVFMVETNYGRKPAYASAPADERAAWVQADALAALDAALAQGTYDQVTLVGKSIGTRALGALTADLRLAGARMIWITPLLNDPNLVEQIRRGGQSGLFVIGTADTFYNAGVLAGLVKDTGGRSVVVDGADHGMEIDGDFWASFRALQSILEAIESFIT